MDADHWTVGELATATGLTVRTLHHWEELGLVAASERTPAGHRRYTAADVRRLYHVVGLRQLGFPLADIGAVLEGPGFDPRDAVRRHLDTVDQRIEAARQLRGRLERVLHALDNGHQPTTEDLLVAVERTTMIEQYYTKEQLAQLEERARALGPDGMAKAQQDWAVVLAEAERHRSAGTDPADPAVQELVRRADALTAAFTGGDPGTGASLQRMYAENDPEQVSRGMVSREVMEYLGQARAAAAGD